MTPNSIFALFFRKTCFFWQKCTTNPRHNSFQTPLMNPSPRIQKKYEQKNVLPARARDIYHPSYTFSSTQYRRYNTASALPPGGDPSQRVRALKATFHHWGRTIFLRALLLGVFVFFVFLMRVGFQWV